MKVSSGKMSTPLAPCLGNSLRKIQRLETLPRSCTGVS